MKSYILIRDDVPDRVAPLVSAHAALAMYLKFQAHPDVQAWVAGPFRKVVCRVTVPEFEKAKAFEDYAALTESSLGGQETVLMFRPRADETWPKAFKFYKLWAPVATVEPKLVSPTVI